MRGGDSQSLMAEPPPDKVAAHNAQGDLTGTSVGRFAIRVGLGAGGSSLCGSTNPKIYIQTTK